MNFQDIKKKDGFTLVEILIVVLIVGVLSTLAVSGYSEYRRSTLLDFSADSIVAQIYEMRDDAIHGDFGGERFEEIKGELEEVEVSASAGMTESAGTTNGEVFASAGTTAKCFGISFSAGSENGINSFSKDYSGKKIWSSVKDDFEFVACDSGSFEDGILELDKMISIAEIYAYKELVTDRTSLNDFSITFIPPDGEFEFKGNGGNLSADSKYVDVVIKYGVSDEGKYKKKLVFDLKSGKVYSESY